MKGRKFEELFEQGRYYECLDGRCPDRILYMIALVCHDDDILKKRIHKLLEKKRRNREERLILRHLKEWYKESVSEEDYNALDIISYQFWSLEVVKQAFHYKVVIPRFNGEYKKVDDWTCYRFFTDVMEGKITI